MEPIWLSVMMLLRGLKEVPGPQNNPVIMNWVRMLKAPSWYDNDDKAWCALGLNAALHGCHLPVCGSGYALLRAAEFDHYGVSIDEPTLGCILRFEAPNHVGLYLGERKDAYYVLGANQSDAITPVWISRARLVSMRWPKDVAMVKTGRIWVADDGRPLSTSEL